MPFDRCQRGLLHNSRKSVVFNVRPNTCMPGFQVGPAEDVSGFRIGSDGEFRQGLGNTYPGVAPDGPWLPAALPDFLTGFVPVRSTFPGSGDARSADGIVTPTLVPAPGGGGSGSDKCTLMPGIRQFGMCLYVCPDGTVRRSHDSPGPLGCRPWILRNDGLGI